jgi:hypothetical protein
MQATGRCTTADYMYVMTVTALFSPEFVSWPEAALTPASDLVMQIPTR